MVNKVILLGRVGNDIELRWINTETAVANISVATDEVIKRSNNKEKHTEWHRVVVFGPLAENCANYLTKGSLVYVEGKSRTRSYEDKDGHKKYVTEVYADVIKFLDSKKTNSSDAENSDDDLPF